VNGPSHSSSPRDADQRRAMMSGLSEAGKRKAEQSKCPKCGRKNAIRRIVDGGLVIRYCRYDACDYETGGYVR
jgi:ribosomal protein L37AE/L43A